MAMNHDEKLSEFLLQISGMSQLVTQKSIL